MAIELNKPSRMKNNTMSTRHWWVSWDKIGKSLFDDYAENYSAHEIDCLRKNSEKMTTQELAKILMEEIASGTSESNVVQLLQDYMAENKKNDLPL